MLLQLMASLPHGTPETEQLSVCPATALAPSVLTVAQCKDPLQALLLSTLTLPCTLQPRAGMVSSCMWERLEQDRLKSTAGPGSRQFLQDIP
jgi:hypothetical protein